MTSLARQATRPGLVWILTAGDTAEAAARSTWTWADSQRSASLPREGGIGRLGAVSVGHRSSTHYAHTLQL